MNITASSHLNFKGLTPSSNSFLRKTINELKKQGDFSQATDISRAKKLLSKKATNYSVIVLDGVIILNPKIANAKSIEIVDGFFKSTPLAAFLRKAAQRIEQEELKRLKPSKIKKTIQNCFFKFVKKFSRA